jgi:hypothetical protein
VWLTFLCIQVLNIGYNKIRRLPREIGKLRNAARGLQRDGRILLGNRAHQGEVRTAHHAVAGDVGDEQVAN